MDLWVTEPDVNTNGQTIAPEGVALVQEENSMFINVWFGWEHASIGISREDLTSLRATLNTLLGEA